MYTRLKTIVAGGLIGTGLLISIICLLGIVLPDQTVENRIGAIASLLILGLPPTGLGIWLFRANQQGFRRRETNRLRQIFFDRLTTGRGEMSVLDFAIAAQIDGDTAKNFLDRCAREFSATFDVKDDGTILYCFDPTNHVTTAIGSGFGQTRADTAPTYDVILQDYPKRKQQLIQSTIADLTHRADPEIRRMLQQGRRRPVAIARDVTPAQAAALRRGLESLGATVLVIWRE